ncbi:Vms1/Ankzf1 family peptidyl-tRNA hydrolase [Streptomyces cavernae]|uniref:baeRF2 domain-containing protein n=1 Tax=Streptomyces cavernae TaxID=2259034 RepID=UPI000FEB69E9|nr:Vms1/Ankzf1 family peptidyl-tRNA hydrolase [Streptomyces cavernae]
MDLAFLQPLYEQPGPWASVYVDTSQRSESMAHERSLMALDVFRQLAAQDADEPTCRAVYTAIEDLQHASEPYGRALFATRGQVVLDPPLARPPQRTSALWAPLPHTAPLLELAEQEPVCLVAYIDRRGAEFELRGALGSENAGEVRGRQWPIHRTASSDWSERHFQLKVENTWEHNAAEVADALSVCQEETRADLIILVGDDRERRSVHERMPKRLLDRTTETEHGIGSRLLDQEVERIRAEHVRRRTEEDLERFLAARAPDEEGRSGAVEGVPALVAAAREHRIDELLIRLEGPDAHREVWIGEAPDQLAVRRTDLTGLGLDTHPVPARADDALLRCAVATGAPAISVSTLAPEEAPAGGLGALLRWA